MFADDDDLTEQYQYIEDAAPALLASNDPNAISKWIDAQHLPNTCSKVAEWSDININGVIENICTQGDHD